MLRTLLDEQIDFDDSHLVCGSCHADRQRDWFYGGHGKRVANWEGERKLYSCVHCHDPHDPTIKPRKPQPPPPVRAGLARVEAVHPEPDRVWQGYATGAAAEQSHEQ